MGDENFDRVIYDLSSKVNQFSDVTVENSKIFNFSNFSSILNKKYLYYVLPNILLLILIIILKPKFLLYFDKFKNKNNYRVYRILILFILFNIFLFYVNYKFMLV